MPGADRDGLTAGPADRLQAVGGAIVALDSGLGHMSEQAPERASCPPAATMAAPQVGQKSAIARQSEQGDVKEEGIGLLAMPDD